MSPGSAASGKYSGDFGRRESSSDGAQRNVRNRESRSGIAVGQVPGSSGRSGRAEESDEPNGEGNSDGFRRPAHADRNFCQGTGPADLGDEDEGRGKRDCLQWKSGMAERAGQGTHDEWAGIVRREDGCGLWVRGQREKSLSEVEDIAWRKNRRAGYVAGAGEQRWRTATAALFRSEKRAAGAAGSVYRFAARV